MDYTNANLGSLAAGRETQVIDWCISKLPYTTSFSAEDVVEDLFEGRFTSDRLPTKIIEAYRVACRDLQRKQILKGISSRPPGVETYVFNPNWEA